MSWRFNININTVSYWYWIWIKTLRGRKSAWEGILHELQVGVVSTHTHFGLPLPITNTDPDMYRRQQPFRNRSICHGFEQVWNIFEIVESECATIIAEMKEGSKSWAELSLNFKGTVRCGGPTSSNYYILDDTRDKRTPGHPRMQHDYAINMQMPLGEIRRSVNF